MGFLGKLFGKKEEEKAKANPRVDVKQAATKEKIDPAKVGLDGKFDESGLAKRVAKALDDAGISDSVGLWVAQTGSTVVFKNIIRMLKGCWIRLKKWLRGWMVPLP